MKCPFELPVEKIYSQIMCCFGIQDKAKHTIVEIGSSENEADYIVQAINSHWNLVEYRQYVHARIADGKPIMIYSEWLDTLEELKQVLKEAKKK